MRSEQEPIPQEPIPQGKYYEFKVQGCLDGDWSYWFDNLQIIVEGDVTHLYGLIPDQAALYGVIATLRNLGLTLLAINQRRPTIPGADQ